MDLELGDASEGAEIVGLEGPAARWGSPALGIQVVGGDASSARPPVGSEAEVSGEVPRGQEGRTEGGRVEAVARRRGFPQRAQGPPVEAETRPGAEREEEVLEGDRVHGEGSDT